VQCLGDFFQLEPITFGSLHSAVVKWAAGELDPPHHVTEIIAATKLFASVQKYELTEQHRSKDPVHTRWLDACRDTTSARPITKEMLADYTVLSRDDAQSDANAMAALTQLESQFIEANLPEGPERTAAEENLILEALLVKQNLWATTPIAVTNNRTRHAINTHRIHDFATQTQQPVISWWNRLVGLIGEHLENTPARAADLEYLRKRNPELKSSFVAGAPGHLLTNMCPVKGYANGTPIIYHSLRFACQEDEEQYKQALEEWRHQGSNPDCEIMVNVPAMINVQVPSVLATTANANERVDTATCLSSVRSVGTSESTPTLAQCVVIPVPLKHKLPNAGKMRHFTLSLPRSQAAWWAENDSSVKKKRTIPLKYEMHPVTVAFALTYHKLQGQTRNKLILNMNKVPRGMNGVTLRHVYVGFSRVKTRNGLRFFPMSDTSSKRYNHLTEKKHDAKLITYLAGFNGDGSQYKK
jgi:hypothetical protein